jgi:ketosteroid isomerase-like protein
MSQATDFVRSLYDAFAAGDVPGFLARLDARVVWNEAEGFPYADGNPYVGPEAIVAGVFARLGRDWSDFQVHVDEIVGGPDVVTMFGRYRGKALKSGRALDVQCAHTWWLRGGKVVRFQQMVDTARVAANLA